MNKPEQGSAVSDQRSVLIGASKGISHGRKRPDAKAFLGIALTVLGLLACWLSLRQSAAYEDLVAENLTIQSSTESLLAGTIEVASGARGYAATGQERFLKSLSHGEESIEHHLKILEALTRKVPEEGIRFRKTKTLIETRLQVAHETVAERKKLRTTPSAELLFRGERAMEEVGKSVQEMEDAQMQLLDQHRKRALQARAATGGIVFVSLAAGILMLFVAGSARQQAQEELWLLKAALEATANAVLITDRKGVVEWINPAFSNLTGYSPDEVIGRSPSFLRSGKHSTDFYREMWETIISNGVWSGEVINQRKDGSHYTEEMTITPVRSEGGRYTHFVAIKQDITEKRQLEEKFRQAQKMESIGTLAGGVAHDFNNWLTVIQGNVDMLYDLLGDKLVLCLEELKEISSAAKSAGSLTKQLLAFSRNQVLQPRVISPNAIISQTAHLLNRLLGEDIVLDLNLASDVGNVRVDPSQLQQVILNLAVNARDAMSKGGTLAISTSNFKTLSDIGDRQKILQPGAYVRLSLRDTGTGMDEITLRHAFEPFFTTKSQGRGTGLGLATVYGIVKQSGGCVFLNSELGRGTEVEVFLPSEEQQISTTCAPNPKRSARGNESILVVEDNDPLRRLVSNGLRKSGYAVLDAANGEEALTKCNGQPVDLLITDCIMPGMDGADLSRRLKRLRPNLNVLYISGHPEETLGDKGAVDPNVMLLKKPFDMADLLLMVRRTLEASTAALAS